MNDRELKIVAGKGSTLKERIGRCLVSRLVDFEIGPPKGGEVDGHGCDKDGKLLIGLNIDTSRLNNFMRWFGWLLYPLRWLP